MATGLHHHLPTYAWMAGVTLLVSGLAAGATSAALAPSADPPPSSSASSAPDSPATETAEAVLVTRSATELGVVASDPDGSTLYRFDDDSNDPPASACEASCAQRWLPLTASGRPSPGAGVDGQLLGTVARSDGSRQVTIDGWPVYTFVGDRRTGDTNGEGVGGSWHAIAPTGKPVVTVDGDVGDGGAGGDDYPATQPGYGY